MDFQKSTVIHVDIHDFGCQSSILRTSEDIHIDIQTRIPMQGHSTMDVRQTWISTNGYPCLYGYQSSIIHDFIDIHSDIHWFLWISMHGLAMDSRSRDWLRPYPPPFSVHACLSDCGRLKEQSFNFMRHSNSYFQGLHFLPQILVIP